MIKIRQIIVVLLLLCCSTAAAADPPQLVTHGPRDRPRVALTFDLCQVPSRPAGFDREVVEVLRRSGTPATFFAGGDWLRTHPAQAAELAAVPGFELGNHSWSHPDLRRLEADDIAREVTHTEALLQQSTGRSPRLFRLPYGNYDARVLQAVAATGVRIIQWDVVSGDPDRQLSREGLIRNATRSVRNGSIIIMHANGRGRQTAAALPEIIHILRSRGLEPVTVTRLLEEDTPPATDSGDTAAGPAFDCSKPLAGSIEELICRDADLARLDRQLAEVFIAATAKAGNEHPPLLKAEQRGWIKGRNDCWKSDDPRTCTEASYHQRISELQARYRLVPQIGPVFFACEGNPANEVVATFFRTDPPSLIAERGDQVSFMTRQPSASGTRYQGRNESFWEHQGEALVIWGYGAPELHCVKRSGASP